MAVNLQKGQKVELKKDNGGELKKVMVGLGWDEAPSYSSGKNIDCDATAFLLKNGKLLSNEDIIYFGNLEHKSKAVKHMGDNLTGEGEGDDEQIFVDLFSLPADYDRVLFVVNIYQAEKRKQEFGMIENAFIRICDAETNKELCRYNLSENYNGKTAMIFGELYRYNGKWKFNAIGQATTDGSISELAVRYR